MPNRHFNLWTLIIISLTAVNITFAQTTHSVSSPDSSITGEFRLSKDSLLYSVHFRDKPVIEHSLMQFQIDSSSIPWSEYTISSVRRSSHDESWEPIWGEQSTISDRYNVLNLTLESQSAQVRRVEIQCRAYDQGLAFRYLFQQLTAGDSLFITAEKTQFKFTDNFITYPVSRPQAIYGGAVSLDSVDYPVEHPMTVIVDTNRYVSVTEAYLDNYSRIKLAPDPAQLFSFTSELAGPVHGSVPFQTPWRLFIFGETPGELIENNCIIYNLNPPNKIEETSWIKPGKAIRIATPFTTARAKSYVDFASKHGLDYVHFDTGWYGSEFSPEADPKTVARGKVRKYPFRDDSLLVDIDMPQVIDYARRHDIGVILYVNHVGLENYDLDEVFSVYKQWGIAGVKFGFVNVGPQKWTNWLHDAVRSAARHQLIVDIHDQYRPTGVSRTYPNLLTQEGIGGDEEWPGPEHELILPFTRFVAGPADHTFTFYSPQMKKTHAFQLAATVVYFSPLQYLYWYDSPDEYDGNPGLKFWENVPTVWDETRVINGQIGDYITVARRQGDEWFIGTLNDSTGRDLMIPLTFLDSSHQYTAEIYTDHSEGSLDNYPVPVVVSKQEVNSETNLRIQLIPGGGHAVHLVPMKK